MAWTVGFALIGALVLAITLVPVLTTFLFKTKLREFHNPVLNLVRKLYLPALGRAIRRPKLAFIVAGLIVLADVFFVHSIGSEFLPHLDEGAIWMRASLPANISLPEAEGLVDGIHTADRNVSGSAKFCENTRKFTRPPRRSAAPTTAPTRPAFTTPSS